MKTNLLGRRWTQIASLARTLLYAALVAALMLPALPVQAAPNMQGAGGSDQDDYTVFLPLITTTEDLATDADDWSTIANVDDVHEKVAAANTDCPCSIWDDTAPEGAEFTDSQAIEVGVRFRSETAGYITGLRFYKGPNNTGTHIGNLWSNNGTLLAQATFVNETTNGWQTVNFANPVAIAANTTYVASYHSDVGVYWAATQYFATIGFDNSPLRALADGEDGPNGVYGYGPVAFPTQTNSSTNYWVDVVYETNATPDTTPPTVESTVPAAGAEGVTADTTVKATFSEPMDPATIDGTTVELRDSSDAVVPATVSYDGPSRMVTITPASPLVNDAQYTTLIRGGTTDPRVKDIAGNALAVDFVSSFTTEATPGSNCPCSIWDDTTTPAVVEVNDAQAIEVGVRFRSSIDGYITGIRFYKGPSNTGTHIGNLWDNNGLLLGQATFANETASGWQTVSFASPVAVAANTTYMASYHSDVGFYSADTQYFATTGFVNSPLRALADGEDGRNGVYVYGPVAFPNTPGNGANYWVDVVFAVNATPDTTPPTVESTVPADGAVNVTADTTVRATFSEPMDPATIDGTTVELRDSTGAPVAATVSYDGPSRTVTIAPASPLANDAQYTTLIRGGTTDPRVKDIAGNALAVDFVSSFTTEATPGSNCPCSIWDDTTTPAVVEVNDAQAIEVGVRFRSSIDGYITGIRFYKGPSNTGTHIGNLWDNNGLLLGQATFANETASGWQTVSFANPVAVTANTTYVASYHSEVGFYSADTQYFAAAGFVNSPLRALADGEDGRNGVYAYGPVAFPNTPGNGANYWVDVVFAVDVTPPSVAITSPAEGATVQDTVTISADANDDVGVASVQFQLDGADLGAPATEAPYTLAWDTTTVSDGAHQLTAFAVDLFGNTATSPVVNVIVSDPVGLPVPDVVGLPLPDAQQAIVAAGLTVGTVTKAYDNTVPAGSIANQDPAAGALVPPGSAVDLVVSAGPAPVTVPDVVGQPLLDAEQAIIDAGLVVGVVERAYSDSVPAGSVIKQAPAGGTVVRPGTAVDLAVSAGPAGVTVPNVVGRPLADAERAIVAAGLTVGAVEKAYSNTVPAGSVIKQAPVGGTIVRPGTAVDLAVSAGPAGVTVPNVVGRPLVDAERAIVAAGLTVGAVEKAYSNTVPAGSIVKQAPAGGSIVRPGTAVDLVVSAGPAAVTVPDVVGLPLANAERAIVAAGLTVGVVEKAYNDTVPVGSIIAQSPVGGSIVAPGSAVKLAVSAGPAPATVPNVVGLPQVDAEQAIVAAGLVVGVVESANSSTVPKGSVIKQSPAGGSSVASGTAVDLVVSTGPKNAVDIGLAGDFAVFGLRGSEIRMEDDEPGVIGDVGLGPDGKHKLEDGFIQGRLLIDPTADSDDINTDVQGVVVTDLSPVVAAALQASSNAASLVASQSFNDIKETRTIVSNGPLTVVTVNKIELKDQKVLALRGGAGDQFIFNISDNLKLENGSMIRLEGGLQPGNVIFNFLKRDATGEFKSGSNASGIFLASGDSAKLKVEDPGSYVVGILIAGDEVSVKKDAQVIHFSR